VVQLIDCEGYLKVISSCVKDLRGGGLMKKSALWAIVLVVFVLSLAAGPDLWAAPGQSVGRQTVPTRTPVPPPTEPPPPPSEPSSHQSSPAPASPDLGQLEASLAAAWESADWQQVINIIGQILAIDPNYDDMVHKLYVAYVNYGHQLLNGGEAGEAIAQFNRALEIKPDGQEALTGLQQASEAAQSGAGRRPSKPLLPNAGGRSVRPYLGAAILLAGLLIVVVVRIRV
jgi:hypothetical protein